MQQRSPLYSPTFWFALTIVASAVVLMILTYNGKLTFIYINLNFTTIHHLFSWIGAGFIVVFTPLFYYLKRRLPRSYKSLIQIHVFGNLVAFVLISVHFAHHLREFEEIIPHPGTGAPLYTGVALLVITGITIRYRLTKKYLRPFHSTHVGLMLAFYLTVVFHVLIGTGII